MPHGQSGAGVGIQWAPRSSLSLRQREGRLWTPLLPTSDDHLCCDKKGKGKYGVEVQACNPSSWDGEEEGLGVEGCECHTPLVPAEAGGSS